MRNIPRQVEQNYLKICKQASSNDEAFAVFKRNECFKKILEHVMVQVSEIHLEKIKHDNAWLLNYMNTFISNDNVGGAEPVNIGDYYISPSTMRYVGILNQIINKFGSLDGLNIIEIGGGYGGQCKIIYDVYKPSSYTIVDLDPVLGLVSRYCKVFNLPITTESPSLTNIKNNYDLVISSYAITELDQDTKKLYIDKILDKSKHGWLQRNLPFQYSRGNCEHNFEAITRSDKFHVIQWW